MQWSGRLYGSALAAVWAVGDVSDATLNMSNCSVFGQFYRQDSPPPLPGASWVYTSPPGTHHVEDVKEERPVLRPRTWRPLSKRQVDFDSRVESWCAFLCVRNRFIVTETVSLSRCLVQVNWSTFQYK